MAISTDNYDGIFAEVQRNLNRDDLSVDDINSYIRLAEKKLYRKLRIPANQKKVLASVVLPDWDAELSPGVPNPDYRPYDASGFGIPGDYLEGYLMTDGNGNAVEKVTAQFFRQLANQIGTYPTVFTNESDQFYFWPSFAGDVFFLYYYEPAAISSTNQENEVTHVIGEAIMFLAISEGWRFVRDMDKYNTFKQIAGEIFGEVTDQWKQQEMSGSTMISKNPYGQGGGNGGERGMW